MSEVFDDIIDRETDVARIAAVVPPPCNGSADGPLNVYPDKQSDLL